jgi:very-short-patch-repair endonuclease
MPGTIRGQADHLDLKRRLRSNMTGPETRLWSRLRARQLQGLKFRRQHGIGPYIVDFYCPERSLVIEVDGDSHAGAAQIVKDKQREKYLQSLGLCVFRYINDDIVKNLDGVLADLAERLSLESTSPHPSLRRRGKEPDR